MTPEQRRLARHALGLTNPDCRKRSYRNRYYASKGSAAEQQWSAMCDAGEAEQFDSDSPHSSHFALTETGARAALEPGESLCPEDFPS